MLGEGVSLISANHNFDSNDLMALPFDDRVVGDCIGLGDYSWVGQNAIVLPGVKIGEYSVVGAGSVVTKNTEPYGIYAGNPARLIRYRRNQNLGGLSTWVEKKPSKCFL